MYGRVVVLASAYIIVYCVNVESIFSDLDSDDDDYDEDSDFTSTPAIHGLNFAGSRSGLDSLVMFQVVFAQYLFVLMYWRRPSCCRLIACWWVR